MQELHVQMGRRGQLHTPKAATHTSPVGPVIDQRGNEDGGIDHDHVWSRAVRTRVVVAASGADEGAGSRSTSSKISCRVG